MVEILIRILCCLGGMVIGTTIMYIFESIMDRREDMEDEEND